MKVFLVLLTLLLSVPSGVYAQSKPLRDNNIMGISLNMTSQEATKHIRTELGGKLLKEYVRNVGNKDHMMTNIHLGFTYQLKDSQEVNLVKYPDTLTIMVDPIDNNKILFIERTKNYSPNEKVLASVFQKAFLEKYGQPKSLGPDWLFAIWSEGTLPNKQPNSQEYAICTGEITTLRHGPEAFVNALEYIESKESVRCNSCGISMALHTTTAGEYMQSFQQCLMDIPRLHNSLNAFKKVLLSNIEKSKNARIMNDSKSKPQL